MKNIKSLTTVAAIALASVLSATSAFADNDRPRPNRPTTPNPTTPTNPTTGPATTTPVAFDLYKEGTDVYVSGNRNIINLEQVGAKTTNAAIAIGKNNKNSSDNRVNVIQNNQLNTSASVVVDGSKNDVQLLQKGAFSGANIRLNSDNNVLKANQNGVSNSLDVETNNNASLNATVSQDGVGGTVKIASTSTNSASTVDLLVNQGGSLNKVDYSSSGGKNIATITQAGESNTAKATVAGGKFNLDQDGNKNTADVKAFSGGDLDLRQKGNDNNMTVGGTKINVTAKQTGNQNDLLISADSNGFLTADVKQDGNLNKAEIYNFSTGGEANVANLTQNGNNAAKVTFEAGNTGGNVANITQTAATGFVGVTIGGANNAVTVKK